MEKKMLVLGAGSHAEACVESSVSASAMEKI